MSTTIKDRLQISPNGFLILVVAVNSILAVLSIVSYANTMSFIVTKSGQGVIKLDYGFLRYSTILVTIPIEATQHRFSFLDSTGYFLVGIIAFNISAFVLGSYLNIEDDDWRIRRFEILSGLIAFIGILSLLIVMTFLSNWADTDPRVMYQYPSSIVLSLAGDYFDPTPWILFGLLAFSLIMVIRLVSNPIKGLRDSE